MAKIVEDRLKKGSQRVDDSKIRRKKPGHSFKDQLSSYRQRQHSNFLRNRKTKVVTMKEITKIKNDEDVRNYGRMALKLTNDFRKKQGKPPLKWSDELCAIGMPHSKDMAHKRVAFGHHGFDRRARAVTFPVGGFFENVAMCNGYANPP